MTRDIGFTPERATKTGPVSPVDSVTSRGPGEGAARADGPVRRSVAGVWTVRALAVRVYAVLVWRWPGGVGTGSSTSAHSGNGRRCDRPGGRGSGRKCLSCMTSIGESAVAGRRQCAAGTRRCC